jgi:Ion channel
VTVSYSGALGAFEDFETALYFSGLTFTSLGYGDVVLGGRVRLIAPLQAANGLMMFGITTGLFIAAFQHGTQNGHRSPMLKA